MVIEAVPHAANKGAAVERLVCADGDDRMAIYFGDDLTDEDAFFALREAGIAIKVCAQPTPSWARYRVASPEEVVAALAEMAAAAGAAAPVN